MPVRTSVPASVTVKLSLPPALPLAIAPAYTSDEPDVTSMVPPPLPLDGPRLMPRLLLRVKLPVARSVPPLSVMFVADVVGTWPSSAVLPDPTLAVSELIDNTAPPLIVVPPE